VEPRRTPSSKTQEVLNLQEAPRTHELVVRDESVGLSVPATSWIRYAWQKKGDEKKKGLPALYAPKEKPIAWSAVNARAPERSRQSSPCVRDAWSSATSAKWLEDNYGYGHANTVARRP